MQLEALNEKARRRKAPPMVSEHVFLTKVSQLKSSTQGLPRPQQVIDRLILIVTKYKNGNGSVSRRDAYYHNNNESSQAFMPKLETVSEWLRKNKMSLEEENGTTILRFQGLEVVTPEVLYEKILHHYKKVVDDRKRNAANGLRAISVATLAEGIVRELNKEKFLVSKKVVEVAFQSMDSNETSGNSASIADQQHHVPPVESGSSHVIVSIKDQERVRVTVESGSSQPNGSIEDQEHVRAEILTKLSNEYVAGREDGRTTVVLLTTGNFPAELVPYVKKYVEEYYVKSSRFSSKYMNGEEERVLDPLQLFDEGGSIFAEYVNAHGKHVVLTAAMINQIRSDDALNANFQFEVSNGLFETEDRAWENQKNHANDVCNHIVSSGKSWLL